ncbi:MAG: 50S ribosomal protein L1 [Simkaniaceae bacterium]|nr:50S ribosomal protein L1 [Simkaniaceae bacterium]
MSSKRHKDNSKSVSFDQTYQFAQAIDLLKQCKPVKFNESIEVSLKTGVDPKKSDQQIRGTVTLPHGTGKTVRVVVIAKDDKAKEALQAGADAAGVELIQKIQDGWTDFDVLISTPEMMREVGKLGKVLGPRGLMPTPKAGTVTMDVAKAVLEVKKGKIEFKADKSGVINLAVGKISFVTEQLVENIVTVLTAIMRAKPVTAKGQYLKSMYLSSTMGPGLKVDLGSVAQG